MSFSTRYELLEALDKARTSNADLLEALKGIQTAYEWGGGNLPFKHQELGQAIERSRPAITKAES